MTKPECREIRRELDEGRLGARLSVATMQHLQGCVECEDFHQKQTKLRQLVGRLGMVEAPADFDLRLRRRLANERSSPGYRFPLILWPVGMRAVSLSVAIVLIFVAIFVVQQLSRPRITEPTVAGGTRQKPESPAPKPNVQGESLPQEVNPTTTNDVAQHQAGQKQRAPIRVQGSKLRPPLATRELSSTAAQVVRTDQSFEATPFTISGSQQFLKLSLDDGSGVRTISVPRVTFGSQRVLATSNTANQFASRGVW
jgi:hypothetical protein